MNANAQNNIKHLLQDILEKFLGNEEFAEITKTLFAKSELPVNVEDVLSPLDKEQIQFEVDHNFNLGSQIDLLITFIELKLPPKEFYEFLLELGQLTITLGELRLAADVHEKILRQLSLPEGKEGVGNNAAFTEIAANAILALGSIYRKEARWDLSIDKVQEALALFEKTGNDKGKAKCERLLGNIKGDSGDLEQAKFHYERSLAFIKSYDDLPFTASLESNLGIIYNIQGLFDEAFKCFISGLDKFEKLNDKRRVAEVRHNIGMMYLQKNDYDSAINEFNKSIAVSTESKNLLSVGMSYLGKAFLYSRMQDHLLATAYSDKAMEIYSKVNDKSAIAEIYKIKGIINKNLKNYSLSENYFLTSLRINRELNNALNEAETYFELGSLYKEVERNAEALKCYNASRTYYLRIDSKNEVEKLDKLISNING